MLPHALPIYYIPNNENNNQPQPPNQSQTPIITSTQAFTPIHNRPSLETNRTMPVLPYQEILPPLNSSPSQWKQQKLQMTLPPQQYYGTPISTAEYSSPNLFPGGIDNSNERLQNQRFFSCPSPHDYKRFPSQNNFIVQHGNVFNTSSSANTSANDTSVSNYEYTPLNCDTKRSTSLQLPQQYPSPPVQFVRSTPSLKRSSMCIQPTHMVQPLYLTTSSTPLSSALSNIASPNSFITQQLDTFLPNPLLERPPSISKPQQYYNPPGAFYDNTKLRFDNQLINANTVTINNVNNSKNGSCSSTIHHSQSKQVVTPVVRKRKRRKYREIKRYYKCQYKDCDKAYGTLNHLNFHIQLQKHGAKRLASEFKDIRNLAKED